MSKIPQELYDNIYDLVFTAEPGVRTLNKQYKIPALLHVSQATREKFSKSYYDAEGVTFEVIEESGRHRPDFVTRAVAHNVRRISTYQSGPWGANVPLSICPAQREWCLIAFIIARITEVKMAKLGVAGTVRSSDSNESWGPAVKDDFHLEISGV